NRVAVWGGGGSGSPGAAGAARGGASTAHRPLRLICNEPGPRSVLAEPRSMPSCIEPCEHGADPGHTSTPVIATTLPSPDTCGDVMPSLLLTMAEGISAPRSANRVIPSGPDRNTQVSGFVAD